MRVFIFLFSLPFFWYGYKLVSDATPPTFYVDWMAVFSSWGIGLLLCLVVFWKQIARGEEGIYDAVGKITASKSKKARYTRPYVISTDSKGMTVYAETYIDACSFRDGWNPEGDRYKVAIKTSKPNIWRLETQDFDT
jgi:hypothetical protein